LLANFSSLLARPLFAAKQKASKNNSTPLLKRRPTFNNKERIIKLLDFTQLMLLSNGINNNKRQPLATTGNQ